MSLRSRKIITQVISSTKSSFYACENKEVLVNRAIGLITYIFPELRCPSHDSISCSLCLACFVMSLRYLCDILNWHKVPYTITCHNQNLIVILKQKVFDFWLAYNSYFVCQVISKWTSQVKASHVILIWEDSELSSAFLASRVSLLAPVCQVTGSDWFFLWEYRFFCHNGFRNGSWDAATHAFNSILLYSSPWYVVFRESSYLPKLVDADWSRVTNACSNNFMAMHDEHTCSCTTVVSWWDGRW